MPTQVTNYQCPACTGPLHYSAKSGKLACDYCGSSFDVAEIEALYARKEAEAAASSKMPDDHMDSIEPFDYAQLRPFSTAYLPGYLADKYDVTIDDSRDRADTRCRETLAQALRDTVTGYGACVTEREDIALRRGKVHYALLPVWMLSTKWHGQDFLFAMNGQTGKLVGDLPTDRGRFWGMFAAIAAPLTVALTAILQFLL